MANFKKIDMFRHELGILKFVVIMVGLAAATLVFRSDDKITNRPVKEDAFYSFTVAHNIASGKGTTIDGTNLTNGFQPLFSFLIAPAFIIAGADKYIPIRLVFVFHWFFFLASAYILGLIGRDAFGFHRGKKNSSLFWWIILIYTTSAAVFVTCFNGLETGFLLFCYAVAWRYYQVGAMHTTSGLVKFGVILGFIVLARIDAVFFVALFSASQLLLDRQSSLLKRFGRFITVSGVALLVSLPWWLYNMIYFGSLMPTSGRAVEVWMVSFDRIKESLMNLIQTMMPVLYLSQYPFEGVHLAIVKLFLAIALVIFLWKRRSRMISTGEDQKQIPATTKRTLLFGVILLLSCLLLVFYYTLASSAVWFYGRYFAPVYLLSCLGIGLLMNEIHKRFSRSTKLFALLVPIPLLAAVCFLHIGKFESEYLQDQLFLVNRHVPPQSYVGAWQTGTLGYFRDKVVNLDGKVNLAALQNQHVILRYIHQSSIKWLCDREVGFKNLIEKKAMEENGWRIVERKGQYVLYHRK